jgi:hypothetical protein
MSSSNDHLGRQYQNSIDWSSLSLPRDLPEFITPYQFKIGRKDNRPDPDSKNMPTRPDGGNEPDSDVFDYTSKGLEHDNHTIDRHLRGRQTGPSQYQGNITDIKAAGRNDLAEPETRPIERQDNEEVVYAKAYESRSSSAHSTASSIISRSSLAFSDLSMASSATSLASNTSISQHTFLIDNITKSLFCTEELKPVLNAACEDFQIGVERLQKNARRLIQHFGKDLRSEVSDKIQLDVARAMKTAKLSSYAAHWVMRHMGITLPNSASVPPTQNGPDNDVEPNSSDDSSDALDDDDEEELWSTEYRHIHDFLYHSEAYSIFKAGLLDFVHKPYEKRILSTIGSDLVGPAGIPLGEDVIHCMAQEISWVPQQALTFSRDVDLSYGDTMKAFVENHLGESWNWWPLAPRTHGLRPGYCRLQWKSVSSPRPTPQTKMT